MRIGIEGQRLFRREKHGMDIVAIELIIQLQKIDLENEYFIFVKDGEADEWFKPSPNFHLVRTKKSFYPYWEQIVLPREVKRNKIDILHCTSNTAPKWVNVPLILTLHDIIYLENYRFVSFQSTLYQLFGNFYRRWSVPSSLKKAKRIITVSQSEKEIILSQYPRLKPKLKVIYNSISDNFLKLDKSKFGAFKERYNLPDAYIFTLGNSSPKKNFVNVLKAYIHYHKETTNPLPLILADIPPAGILPLLRLKIPSEIESDIRYIGYVDNSEIPLLYAFSSVFIYVSLRESFGIPILEGMAAGAPVITSTTSSMPEIAGGAAALVDPDDVEGIAAKISEIVRDKAYAKQLIEKGKKRVEFFSWKNSALELFDVYKELETEIKKKKNKSSKLH